ncbi:MAG: formyltransferase family protein [Halobacteriota archaeon]
MTVVDERLRVGLLLPGDTVRRWEYRAIEDLAEQPDIEVTHVVVNDADRSKDGVLMFATVAIDQIREYPLWSLVGITRLLTPTPEYRRSVRWDDIDGVESAEEIRCTPEPNDGFGNELPEEVVDEVGQTDVILRFGFGFITGEILDRPTYGVLSYHPGDIRRYRGQPGGLWEFLADETEAGVTIQQLTETLDGGRIVAFERVDIADANTFQEVQQRLFRTAERMLVDGVRNLTDSSFSPEEPETLGELYSLPKGKAVLRYVVKNTRGRVRNRIETILAGDAQRG